jgi:Condensation domain
MIENIFWTTDMQKSMILASLELSSYIESFTYSIQGAVKPDTFLATWSAVIAKHDALRSIFVQCNLNEVVLRGEILQVVLPPGDKPSTLTLGGSNPTPLKFAYGKPTMQVHLCRIGGEYQFIWEYHHALFDGWLSGIILCDFQAAYVDHPMCAPVSFEGFRRITECSQDSNVRKFWKLQLHEARPNRLVDYSRPAVPAPRDQLPADWCYDHTLVFSVERVSACAAAETTTVASILRATWAVALAYFYGEEDVVFGGTTSGRTIDITGVEEVVEHCVNTVPFRIRVGSSESRKAYLRKAHSISAALVENDSLSFYRIYEVTGTSDLFDTTLVYRNCAKFPHPSQVSPLPLRP